MKKLAGLLFVLALCMGLAVPAFAAEYGAVHFDDLAFDAAIIDGPMEFISYSEPTGSDTATIRFTPITLRPGSSMTVAHPDSVFLTMFRYEDNGILRYSGSIEKTTSGPVDRLFESCDAIGMLSFSPSAPDGYVFYLLQLGDDPSTAAKEKTFHLKADEKPLLYFCSTVRTTDADSALFSITGTNLEYLGTKFTSFLETSAIYYADSPVTVRLNAGAVTDHTQFSEDGIPLDQDGNPVWCPTRMTGIESISNPDAAVIPFEGSLVLWDPESGCPLYLGADETPDEMPYHLFYYGGAQAVISQPGQYCITLWMTDPSGALSFIETYIWVGMRPGAFDDVAADAYYAEAVKWAAMNDITAGTSSTAFSPETTCTRGQILTFLWRAAGSPEPENRSAFSDVAADAYYAEAAAWAKEEGIASGDTFSPEAPCTRLMAVEFMWKLAGSPGADQAAFADVSSEAVNWAVETGVTSGTSTENFSPNDTCTRAQIVTFLYRAFAA